MAIVVLSIVLMVISQNDVLRVLIAILGVAGIGVVFLLNWNTKKIVSYLEVVKDFYIDRLCEYEGFENVLVQHQYVKNGYLQSNQISFGIQHSFLIKFRVLFGHISTETLFRLSVIDKTFST